MAHGSPAGITGVKRTVLRQGLAGAAGTAESGDGFGAALSVGNGLWIGAPGEDYGRARDAGVVTKFRLPLTTQGSIQYRQGARNVPGVPETGDRFGAALADGGTAIGAPGEDIGSIVDAGTVTWGLTHALSQNSFGVPGKAERGDQFGASVAAREVTVTDVESRSKVDIGVLAVGAPGEDIGNVRDAGNVTLIGGYDDSQTGYGWDSLTQAEPSTEEQPEAGDRFGSALYLVADTPADPTDNAALTLIVGAPGEDVGSTVDAGAVALISIEAMSGDMTYVTPWVGTTIRQGDVGHAGLAETADRFGASVARPPDSTGFVFGAPGQAVAGRAQAGAITIYQPEWGTSQEVSQGTPFVPGSAEAGDRFGVLLSP